MILALYRLLRILLDAALLEKETKAMLADRVRASVREAASVRLGRNILVAWLKENAPIVSYLQWDLTNDSAYEAVTAPRTGVVRDINLHALADLTGAPPNGAGRSGLSVTTTESGGNQQRPTQATTEAAARSAYRPQAQVYVLKSLGDSVRQGEVLARVPRGMKAGTASERRAPDAALRAYVINDAKEGAARQLQEELRELRNRVIDAIRARREDRVKAECGTYEWLARTFMEALSEIGARYSFEAAAEERKSLGGGWSEVEWLDDDIRLFLKEAQTVADGNVFHEALRLPIHIAWEATQLGDHYVFSQFIGSLELAYHIAVDDSTSPLLQRRILKDIRDLTTFTSRYIINPMLDGRPGTAGSPDDAVGYATALLQVLSRTAKAALDQGRYSELSHLADAIRTVANPSERWRDHTRRIRERALRPADGDQRQDPREVIAERANEALYGLAAFALAKLWDKPGDVELRRCLSELLAFVGSAQKELVPLLNRCLQDSTEQRWGWSWWEMTSRENGDRVAFGVIRVGEKLLRTYVYASLLLAPKATGKPAELPPDPKLATSAQRENGLLAMLKEAEQGTGNWSHVLSDDQRSRVKSLKAALENVVAEHERQEKERVRNASLSSAKVERFKAGVLKAYAENSQMWHLLSRFGLVKQAAGNEPGAAHFRYREVTPKEFFVEPPVTEMGYSGESYGEGLASGQTSATLEKLVERCTPVPHTQLAEAVERMGLSGSLMVVAGAEWLNEPWRWPDFKVEYPADDTPERQTGLSGRLSVAGVEIPVYVCHDDVTIRKVLVLDSTRLAEMSYELARDQTPRTAELPRVDVDVTDLAHDDAARKAILAEKPAWLLKVGEEPQQDQHLRDKVLLDVHARFWLKLHDQFSGFVLTLPPSDDAQDEGDRLSGTTS